MASIDPLVPDPDDSGRQPTTSAADSTDEDPADVTDLSQPMQRLMAAAAAIGRVATVEGVAAALVDSGVSAVHGTKGVVALVEDTGTYLELVAASGYEPGYLRGWQRFPVTTNVPVAEAVRTGQHVVVASVEEFLRRYPDVKLPDQRPHALVAVPLRSERRIVGAWGVRLDTSPDPKIAEVAAAATASKYLGEVASAGIARVSTARQLQQRVGQLQRALTSRIAIEQAKGVLAERHGLTVSQAFDALRRYARNNGRRIHEVAESVLDGDLDLA